MPLTSLRSLVEYLATNPIRAEVLRCKQLDDGIDRHRLCRCQWDEQRQVVPQPSGKAGGGSDRHLTADISGRGIWKLD